jgi:hypothetical protein
MRSRPPPTLPPFCRAPISSPSARRSPPPRAGSSARRNWRWQTRRDPRRCLARWCGGPDRPGNGALTQRPPRRRRARRVRDRAAARRQPALGAGERAHLAALFRRACGLGRRVLRHLPRQSRPVREGRAPAQRRRPGAGLLTCRASPSPGSSTRPTASPPPSRAGGVRDGRCLAAASDGSEVISGTRGMNLPIAGFAEAAGRIPTSS